MTRRSKRHTSNTDINIHSLTGWRSLPWELQKSVLVSHVLSLRDLAKLALLGKVFKEAYLERCAEEEQWLEHATFSVFGAQAVDPLVCWVSSLKWVFEPPGLNLLPEGSPTVLRLSEGKAWPDLRPALLKQTVLVEQPACFLPGDPKQLIWHFASSWKCRRREIWLQEGTRILSIECHGRQLSCCIYPRNPAHVLPCLGLVYLVCKKAAESFGRRCIQVPRQGWRFSYVSVRGPEWHQKAEWHVDDAPGVPPYAKRAFTAISMRSWNSGRCKFRLSLELKGWAPLPPFYLSPHLCAFLWPLHGCREVRCVGSWVPSCKGWGRIAMEGGKPKNYVERSGGVGEVGSE
jgi:hypothetical protein